MTTLEMILRPNYYAKYSTYIDERLTVLKDNRNTLSNVNPKTNIRLQEEGVPRIMDVCKQATRNTHTDCMTMFLHLESIKDLNKTYASTSPVSRTEADRGRTYQVYIAERYKVGVY